MEQKQAPRFVVTEGRRKYVFVLLYFGFLLYKDFRMLPGRGVAAPGWWYMVLALLNFGMILVGAYFILFLRRFAVAFYDDRLIIHQPFKSPRSIAYRLVTRVENQGPFGRVRVYLGKKRFYIGDQVSGGYEELSEWVAGMEGESP